MVRFCFKEECVRLRRLGLSVPDIAKVTGKSKSTVYSHTSHIPLLNDRIVYWRKTSRNRLVQVNHAKLGISRLGRHPVRFITWTPDLVELVAHLMFDGQIRHTGCVYHNRSAALICRVKTLVLNVYKFPPIQTTDPTGVHRITFNSVELSALIKAKTRELTEIVLKLPKEQKRAFLRAFFDDEGCVRYRPKEKSCVIRGYQHNIPMLKTIKDLLEDFDIEGRIDEKYNEITISKHVNIQKFSDEINFMPGLCVNGNRSNSIWKESIEKREILRRALAAYQS